MTVLDYCTIKTVIVSQNEGNAFAYRYIGEFADALSMSHLSYIQYLQKSQSIDFTINSRIKYKNLVILQ